MSILIRQATQSSSDLIGQLVAEHQALVRHYGKAQARCSDLMSIQAAELVELRSQTMRLRAAVIVRDTALAWECEDRAASNALIPGLPRRTALARRVDRLMERIQALMRERLHWQWRRSIDHAPTADIANIASSTSVGTIAIPTVLSKQVRDTIGLENSLAAADLVICQTGCLSHDAYWRVQDHCKRTGKTCVVVAQPEALKIIRIHQMS